MVGKPVTIKYPLSLKVLTHIILISLLLIIGINYKFYLDTNTLLQDKHNEVSYIVQETVENIIDSKYVLMEGLIYQIKNDQRLLLAFANGNRQELTELTAPSMEHFHGIGIEQFQFHNPDASSFLRVHMLDKYSDDLSSFRKTVVDANRFKQTIKGLEIGFSGPGLRYVEPLEYNGVHLGSVELGLGLEELFLNRLKDITGGEWLLYLETVEGKEVLSTTSSDDPDLITNKEDTHKYAIETIPLIDYSGNVDLYLARIYDKSESIAAAKSYRDNNILFGSVIAFLAILVTMIFMRRTFKPLHVLTERTEILASGDFSQNIISTGSNDEIGILANTMEKMRLSIIEYNKKIINSEQQLRLITDSTNEIICTTDANGDIQYISKSVNNVLGYSKDRAIGKSIFALIHYEDSNTAMEAFNECMKENKNDIVIVKYRHIEGHYLWLSTTAKAVTDHLNKKTIVIVARDITEVKKAELELKKSMSELNQVQKTAKLLEEKNYYLAYHDSLTGIPNRLSFVEDLQKSIDNNNGNDEKIAVLYMDIDRFKWINDSLGHHIGDKVLQFVVERLKNIVNEEQSLYRIGGDEFAIVSAKVENILQLATNIIKESTKVLMVEGNQLHVTSSIGICIFPDDGEDIYTILRNADTAMSEAKEIGRNKFLFYNDKMIAKTIGKLTQENDMQMALKNQDFVLYYQPQVELTTGKIVGMEALLRWEHQEFGIIPPGQFISLAEESGMIIEIGEWVLRTACKQLKTWENIGLTDCKMAINISQKQFLQQDFYDMVIRIIEEEKIKPQCIELEITESIAIYDIDLVMEILNKLFAYGVQISIDDFGTGYSSLNNFRIFPIQKLKIDRSFISSMDDSKSQSIINTIIAMAQNLGLKVVAEGVETMSQLDYLKKLNCDQVQGYYFSRPLPADDFIKFYNYKKSNE